MRHRRCWPETELRTCHTGRAAGRGTPPRQGSRRLVKAVLLVLLLALLPARVSLAQGTVRYVVPGGLTSGACDSWAHGCDLAYALGTVAQAGSGDELWVKAGTYTPGTSASQYFGLKNGVAIYGGFAGTGSETSHDDRDWQNNETILSGALTGGASANHVVVASSLGNPSTARLDGFTITGGYAGSSASNKMGGGMYLSASSPTLANLVLRNNVAVYGGAMYLSSSSPSMDNVTFDNNRATVTVSASGQSGGMGGGIYASSSSPTLTHVIFDSNVVTLTTALSQAVSGAFGGGMYLYNSNPSLSDVTFSHNHAGGIGTNGGRGGGIYASVSSPLLSHVIFDSNVVTLTTTLTQTIAGGMGGGMYVSGGSPVLRDVTFTTNLAGGLAPTQYNCWGGGGGAVYVSYGNFAITRGSFTGNITNNSCGGALYLYASGYSSGNGTTLTDVSFDGNQSQSGYGAHPGGGALYTNSTLLTATNITVTNNLAAAPGWDGTRVSDVSVPSSWGGGLLLTLPYKAAIFNGLTVTGNSAVLGGGIYVNSSKSVFDTTTGNGPVFNNATIANNSAIDSGGGMFNDNWCRPVLNGVTLDNNVAATLNGSDTAECLAHPGDPDYCGGGSGGGAMYNWKYSSVVITNTTFSGNRGGLGGAIYNDKGSGATLVNVTLAGNTALGIDKPGGGRSRGLGAGVYNVMTSTLQAVNTIIWGNTSVSGTLSLADPIYSAPIDYLGNASPTTVTVSYSDVQGGIGGTGNLDVDPLLGALGTYGGLAPVYPLLPGSAAIDAGAAATSSVACPASDQRGVDRPQPAGGRCDMGAFESQGFTLTKAGGDLQSAAVDTSFPLSLTVTVASSHGEPVDGGQVTFSAPASGPSAAISPNPAAIAAGQARVTASARAAIGSYLVGASARGAAPALDFSLTNVAACAPPSSLSFGYLPAQPHANQTVSFSGAAQGDPPLSYAWSFGDGAAGSAPVTSHMFARAGQYSVVMTVTGTCGTPQAIGETLSVIDWPSYLPFIRH